MEEQPPDEVDTLDPANLEKGAAEKFRFLKEESEKLPQPRPDPLAVRSDPEPPEELPPPPE